MLNFIIGKKGNGKTAYVHKLLGSYVEKGTPTMLIVPRQFTFESDKGVLELLGPRKASEVEIFSFSRLCDAVLKTVGGVKKPILSQGARNVMMGLTLDELTDKLKIYSKQKDEKSLVDMMLSAVDSFKRNGITEDEIDEKAKILENGMLKDKLTELSLVYRTFNAMVAQSFFDDADLLTKVAELLKDSHMFDGKVIAIDGFASFTAQELSIIELMLSNSEEFYVSLVSDDITDINELSPFAMTNNTARRLRLLAGKHSIQTGKIIDVRKETGYEPYSCAELSHLERNIYNPLFTTFEGENKNIEIVNAPTVNDECENAARTIRSMIRQNEYRLRDIIIVFRNGDAYEKRLRSALKKFDIPLFEDKRQPIENQPLIVFVQTILDICASGYSSDKIFCALKTGLFGPSFDETAEIENYTLMWSIDGNKWLSPWTENPDGFGEKISQKSEENLEKINSMRADIINPIVNLRENLKNADGRKSGELLYNFLIENGVDKALKDYALTLEAEGNNDLSLEQEQIWDMLMEILDEIAMSLGEKQVSAKRLSEIFNLIVASHSLGKLPDGFDDVSIIEADRILTKTAKVVFILGANDGVFPTVPSSGGLLNYGDRLKLSEIDLDFDNNFSYQNEKERFLVYNALSAAKEKLFISYSLLGGKGEKLQSSEIVTDVRNMFPSIKEKSVAAMDITQLIEGVNPTFSLTCSHWNDNTEKSSTLREYFSHLPEFHEKIEAIERAVDKKDFQITEKETAKKLFGENLYLSPTRVDVYYECPFRYFCRFGLKAKKREKARLNAANTGTIIHYVLEHILKNHQGREFLELSEDILDNEIKEIMREYLDVYMGAEKGKDKRFTYLYNRMYKILKELLFRLRNEFCDSDFEPCDFELKIGREENVKPFKVKLEEGCVEVFGVIDRVDKLDLGSKRYIRIVDYKTGVKKFSLGEVLEGINMQMLIYLVSIWRNGSGYYENIEPSGVLYFPARMVPNNIERSADEEERRNIRLQSGKMNGLLVDNPEIIGRMDKDGNGIFLPLKYDTKSGEFKGDFIKLSTLGKLADIMDNILKNMGDSLHEGKIEALPICGTSHDGVCDYCEFSGICMREGNERKRYVESRKFDDCIKLIEKEDEKNGKNMD